MSYMEISGSKVALYWFVILMIVYYQWLRDFHRQKRITFFLSFLLVLAFLAGSVSFFGGFGRSTENPSIENKALKK